MKGNEIFSASFVALLFFFNTANAWTPTCHDFHAGIPANWRNVGDGVSWLRTPSNNSPCSVQGVLQLKPPSGATEVTIHMRFENATDWAMNFGDSHTNNGYSGDAGSTVGYNAEFQKKGSYVTFYHGISFPQKSDLFHHDAGVSHPLTIRVSKEMIFATDYNQWMYSTCTNEYRLYHWDDMYLGINRVVSGNYRSGKGFCHLCVEWH